MTIPEKKRYPRTHDRATVYLNSVVSNPNIIVGDYTIYNDFVSDPTQFETNNVLYHYPINKDRLIIGKFLFHRVRGKVPVHQCQSHPEVALDVSISHLL